MTGMILNAQDEALVAVDDLSELVRGQEQSLLERMAPVVRRQTVTLDLGRVERIDAAGIAALISLYGCARDAGHHFTVTNATPRVAGILALVGLDRILVSHNAVRDSQYESCLEMPSA
jgi:anti-anti-sigma factor